MPYILNRRPKPKPPQNNVMTINKALKAVNDTMDWTVLFIVLLLVMVGRERLVRYPALLLTFSYQLSMLAENALLFVCSSISVIPYVSSIYS